VPSPVAHACAGLAIAGVASYVCRRPGGESGGNRPGDQQWRAAGLTLALTGAAIAPDFDFVPGLLVGYPDWLHRGVSHSPFGSAVFGLLAAGVARRAGVPRPARFGAWMGLAYLSHLVLDLFSPGLPRFIGLPLAWPLTDRRFLAPAVLFLDVRRDPTASGFVGSLWQAHNLNAALWELMIMAPLLAAARLIVALLRSFRTTDSPLSAPAFDRRVDSEL
jgi:membrane-bound metal-dependent hydrolase YbcI (DUF457 family)